MASAEEKSKRTQVGNLHLFRLKLGCYCLGEKEEEGDIDQNEGNTWSLCFSAYKSIGI